MANRIRQNFQEDCEAFINKQINMEFYASFVYLSMVSWNTERRTKMMNYLEMRYFYIWVK